MEIKLAFAFKKATKGTICFEEQGVAKDERPITLYLKKSALGIAADADSYDKALEVTITAK